MNARSRGGLQADLIPLEASLTFFVHCCSAQEKKGPHRETATVHRFVGHVASAWTAQWGEVIQRFFEPWPIDFKGFGSLKVLLQSAEALNFHGSANQMLSDADAESVRPVLRRFRLAKPGRTHHAFSQESHPSNVCGCQRMER